MISMVTWFVLLVAFITGLVWLALSTFARKRRHGEPPIVAGSFLWGSAKDFNCDAVNFLQSACREYGDVFTIRLLHQHLTVVMDPHSYETLTKTKTFDFDAIQKQVNWNVFQFVLREPKKMIQDTGKTVRGTFLGKSLENFDSHLQRTMAELGKDGRTTGGLRQFGANTLFESLFCTIFGQGKAEEWAPEQTYQNFELFHKYFNYLWLGMPLALFPAAQKALEQLLRQPSGQDLLDRHDSSDYIKTAVSYMKEQGQTEADIRGHNLVYLHVNYNTFRLAFWVMSNLLQNPDALEKLQAEVQEAIREREDEETKTAGFTVKELETLPLLDSIVQETIRLSSGVFVVRYVTEDTMFKTESGKEFLIRAGDRVAVYPPAIHKDEEIFAKPLEFQADRFINAKFYKNGRQLKHPTMAFGSVCPGKRYALLQLKWYLLNVISRFDLYAIQGQQAEPDYNYYGHEILPPVKDIHFQFQQRQSHTQLKLIH